MPIRESNPPDGEFDTTVGLIRQTASDKFALDENDFEKVVGKIFADVGFATKDDDGELKGPRSVTREKEYSFRPRRGMLSMDQMNFRIFKAPTGDTPDAEEWELMPDEAVWEVGSVSDIFAKYKDDPGWNPSNMHGENRSSLIISRRELEDEDKRVDLPARYFGRMNDLIVPQSTQDIQKKRKKFEGGRLESSPETDDQLGEITDEDEFTDERKFFDRDASEEDYTEGVFKSAINITPFDQPGITLDQLNENNDGPGDDGFTGFDYIPGIIDDPAAGGAGGVGSTVVAEEADDHFQGGWLTDTRTGGISMFHDIIGINHVVNRQAKLPRYLNRFSEPVGLSYIRHDAHFAKVIHEECPPPIGQGLQQSGRIHFTKVFK